MAKYPQRAFASYAAYVAWYRTCFDGARYMLSREAWAVSRFCSS